MNACWVLPWKKKKELLCFFGVKKIKARVLDQDIFLIAYWKIYNDGNIQENIFMSHTAKRITQSQKKTSKDSELLQKAKRGMQRLKKRGRKRREEEIKYQ
ncbi:MAG: hypothetical protein Q8P67_13185 [archaeon]|nr:hypothetical protein [archaeon]